MKIILNGSDTTVQGVSTLADLLADLLITPDNVVIELNEEIIQPEAYKTKKLHNADSIEIIRFVGGG